VIKSSVLFKDRAYKVLKILFAEVERKEKKSEGLKKNGWLPTGEQVKQDQNGYFYFLGRMSERVIGIWILI
jgi:acyl-CoA synthetase (AMP-forming)/AMP-acid ligase II